MKIIAKPKQEQKILSAVSKNAIAKEIYKGMVERSEDCVDHLCGCAS